VLDFSLPIIPLNKFDYKNAILLVLLKKDKSLYCIRYIVDIIEKDMYSLLQSNCKIFIIYLYL